MLVDAFLYFSIIFYALFETIKSLRFLLYLYNAQKPHEHVFLFSKFLFSKRMMFSLKSASLFLFVYENVKIYLNAREKEYERGVCEIVLRVYALRT